MPAPRAPATLDDLPLSDSQRQRLQRLVTIIWQEEPTRDEAAVVAQAEDAFRRTVRRIRGAWRDQTRIRLGDGTGPVLELKT